LGSEGVAAAPKTVVSAVAEDGARTRKSKGKKVKEADDTEVAAAIWPMSPDAVC
jgi:hypothetical protein